LENVSILISDIALISRYESEVYVWLDTARMRAYDRGYTNYRKGSLTCAMSYLRQDLGC